MFPGMRRCGQVYETTGARGCHRLYPRPDLKEKLLAESWNPSSWRGRPIKQVPQYPDAAALAALEAPLKTYPPLVLAGQAPNPHAALAHESPDHAFLLQGA